MDFFPTPDYYADLDALELPTIAGRRLDVGGFVFTDPFEEFLTKLSEEYLAETWSNLGLLLKKYRISVADLTWGWPHPGETGLTDDKHRDEPHEFIGWTSQNLAEFYKTKEFNLLDEELKQTSPQLRCIATWRSLKWNIAPTDFKKGLKLIEYHCATETSEWTPLNLESGNRNFNEPWIKVIKAIEELNQAKLDLAFAEARGKYSPAGFRIVLLAAKNFLKGAKIGEKLTLPELI